MAKTVRVVWEIENVATGEIVAVSLDEQTAIDTCKAQPAEFTGHFVVMRSLLIGGRVV